MLPSPATGAHCLEKRVVKQTKSKEEAEEERIARIEIRYIIF